MKCRVSFNLLLNYPTSIFTTTFTGYNALCLKVGKVTFDSDW